MYPRLLEVTPTENGRTEFRSEMGITLRDWFAGQALAGLLASHRQGDDWPGEPAARQGVEPQHVIARGSYDIADAMLAAREVKP